MKACRIALPLLVVLGAVSFGAFAQDPNPSQDPQPIRTDQGTADSAAVAGHGAEG